MIRILARSAKPAAPVFRLEGGPGLTNMNFPDASRFAANHDLVLVGYRGVDGSSKLGCPEVTSAREHARDFLSEESFRADAAAFKACALASGASQGEIAKIVLGAMLGLAAPSSVRGWAST